MPVAPALSLAPALAPALALASAPALNSPGGSAAPSPGGIQGRLQLLIIRHGGHNGFHGQGDGKQRPGCWGDRLTARWLQYQLDLNG